VCVCVCVCVSVFLCFCVSVWSVAGCSPRGHKEVGWGTAEKMEGKEKTQVIYEIPGLKECNGGAHEDPDSTGP